MGYYIQVPEHKNKAQQLVNMHGAIILPGRPEAFEDVPDDLAIICVVDNGPFEAAALCYSRNEFITFTTADETGPSGIEHRGGAIVVTMRSPHQERGEQRPRTWVLMNKPLAHRAAGEHRTTPEQMADELAVLLAPA